VRWGLAASLMLHAGLLLVLGFGTWSGWMQRQPTRIYHVASTRVTTPTPDGSTSATVVIHKHDPAPQDLQQQLEKSLAASEELSDAERFDSLDKAARRLNRISSETSLDDVSQRLQSWLGLSPRADRPTTDEQNEDVSPAKVDSTETAFDFDTAQLHDVKRVVVLDRRPKYTCVLLDAHGQTLEVPLSESEGEPIYVLMEKIKAHPLLEQIYRQLAMPLLDQMVQAEAIAAKAAGADSADSAAQSQAVVPGDVVTEGEAAEGDAAIEGDAAVEDGDRAAEGSVKQDKTDTAS